MITYSTTFDIVMIYIIIIISIFLFKPNCLFNKKNNKCYFKEFGFKNNQTYITIEILSIIIAIILYSIVIGFDFIVS
jgi:hypothetical protein